MRPFKPTSATFSAPRRSRSCSREWRSPGSLQPNTVLRAGFGVFSDLLPGSVADLIGTNPPYVKHSRAGCSARSVERLLRPGVPNSAIDATVAANQHFAAGFAQGELSCASPLANPAACLPPVAITAVPSGKLHAPYFMQWSLGLEHQFGNNASVQAQYVGTRAVESALPHASERLPDRMSGCFAPFPYLQPTDPRFAAVTQLSTGADSHYSGLQLTADEAPRPWPPGANQLHLEPLSRLPSPTAAFCNSPPAAFSRPCPANSPATTAPATTTFAIISRRNMSINCRSRSKNHTLGLRAEWLADFRHGFLAQRHSVLGSEHPLLCERRRHRARAAVRSSPASFPACRSIEPGPSRGHSAWNHTMAESECVRLRRRSEHRCLQWRRHSAELPVRKSGSQRVARPRFLLERLLPDKMVK